MKVCCPRNLLYLTETNKIKDKISEVLIYEDHLLPDKSMYFFDLEKYKKSFSPDVIHINTVTIITTETYTINSDTQAVFSNPSTNAVMLFNKDTLFDAMRDMLNHYYNNVFCIHESDLLQLKCTETVFIVSSILYITNQNDNNKGCYEPEERFHQTIHQLESIRDKNPTATIVFIDASEKINLRYITKISNLCDYVLLTLYHPAQYIVNTCKQNGELFSIMHVLQRIDYDGVKYIVKCGGRYSLSRFFDPKTFFQENKSTVCCKNNQYYPETFCIHIDHLPIFLQILPKDKYSMEKWLKCFTEMIGDDAWYNPTELGICGSFAHTGSINIL